MMTGPIDECEIKADGKWVTISILDAMMLRNTHIRCKACGGRIRVQMKYTARAAPYFMHFSKHDGCSDTTRLFSGVASRHPEALD
jgi:DNA-directed RNA polymerase subunit RPC12/RpoP